MAQQQQKTTGEFLQEKLDNLRKYALEKGFDARLAGVTPMERAAVAAALRTPVTLEGVAAFKQYLLAFAGRTTLHWVDQLLEDYAAKAKDLPLSETFVLGAESKVDLVLHPDEAERLAAYARVGIDLLLLQ